MPAPEQFSALQSLIHASPAVQLAVGVLLTMSIASWALIIWKHNQLKDHGRASKRIATAANAPRSIEHALRDQLLEEQTAYELGLDWLGSIASTAPYVGLFGTVMGVLHAFTGLAIQADTSLQAVAPGIAEALVVTALGLLTAIPAALGFNRYQHKCKAAMASLEVQALRLIDDRKADHAE